MEIERCKDEGIVGKIYRKACSMPEICHCRGSNILGGGEGGGQLEILSMKISKIESSSSLSSISFYLSLPKI